MKSTLLLFATLLLSAITIHAQQVDSLKHPLPLRIAVLDESMSLPNFWFTRYAYNPAIMIGTEYPLSQKARHDWYISANLGFYYHKKAQSAIFLNTALGYRYRLGRWQPSASLGLGYAHSFYPGQVYEYTDGAFQETSNTGHPNFMPSVALNLGYQIRNTAYSPSVFVTFMSAVDIPFRQETSLHQFVGIGYQFYPFK